MSPHISLSKQRIAVGFLFFMHGLCFATWASRIPHLQQEVGLSDTQLGLFLFAIPVGDLMTMPFSGWLATRFGTHKLVIHGLLGYFSVLVVLGILTEPLFLLVGLACFGMTSNLVNICVNTQSVLIQKQFQKPIIASFHGIWSLSGFAGAVLSAGCLHMNISRARHFLLVGVMLAAIAIAIFPYLVRDTGHESQNKQRFYMPHKSLIVLGVLACSCMICEGAMFDWSGVYFKKVVRAPAQWQGLGYATFMGTMALGRFISDFYIQRFGIKVTLQTSSILVTSGLLISVFCPTLLFATAGFFMVGLGVASVIPIVYGTAGKSEHVSPPIALAIVSTIGFGGFLIGPPLLGAIAGATDLRFSFALIALMGVLIGLTGSTIKSKTL